MRVCKCVCDPMFVFIGNNEERIESKGQLKMTRAISYTHINMFIIKAEYAAFASVYY